MRKYAEFTECIVFQSHEIQKLGENAGKCGSHNPPPCPAPRFSVTKTYTTIPLPAKVALPLFGITPSEAAYETSIQKLIIAILSF